MIYKSLFEKNSPLINLTFNDISELEKMIDFFIKKSTAEEKKLLELYKTHYIDNYKKDNKLEPEFLIFSSVIRHHGVTDSVNADLHKKLNNFESYKEIIAQAIQCYNFLVSNYNLWKNRTN